MARGGPASPSTVAIYKMLALADRPLSLSEIGERLDSAFRADAYGAWREYQERAHVYLAEKWPADMQEAAWQWWVQRRVTRLSRDKYLLSTQRDGGPARAISPRNPNRDSLIVYMANPDRPPTVLRPVTRMEPVPWTPDVQADTERHIARMTYGDLRKEFSPNGRTNRALTELIKLADKALGIDT